MRSVPLADVVAHLDRYLRIREIPDYPGAANGLQVENSGRIGSVIAAVDASQATIDGAADAAAGSEWPPLLLVHHGLFWDGVPSITGRRYRRLRTLLAHDVAVYSAHLPLDVHPEVGNNAVLARELGLAVEGEFGSYKGLPIGVRGTVGPELRDRDAFLRRLAELLRLPAPPRLIPGGPVEVHRVGIVTGGAGTLALEAAVEGLDTFVTGEGPHHTYFDAMEGGVNVVHAGHYATETVGVRALAEHVAVTFGIPFAFHDHPTGL